jgi:hypothetical protein
MTTRTTVFADSPPPELFKLARGLERWRASAQRGRRIPEPLWEAAACLARTYGVSPISAALKLSYYDLQRRAQGEGAVSTQTQTQAPPSFIELAVPKGSPALSSHGTIEVVHADGARLLVRLPEAKFEDLLALMRAFLDHRS